MDRLLKRWRRLEGCDSVLELRKRGRQSNVSSEGSYGPQQAVIPGARLIHLPSDHLRHCAVRLSKIEERRPWDQEG